MLPTLAGDAQITPSPSCYVRSTLMTVLPCYHIHAQAFYVVTSSGRQKRTVYAVLFQFCTIYAHDCFAVLLRTTFTHKYFIPSEN